MTSILVGKSKTLKDVSSGDLVLAVRQHEGPLLAVVDSIVPAPTVGGTRIYFNLPTWKLSFPKNEGESLNAERITQYSLVDLRLTNLYASPEEVARYLEAQNNASLASRVLALQKPYTLSPRFFKF